MRLDKYLCELNIGTRSQVKDYIRQGLVEVNGDTVKIPEYKVSEKTDRVCFKGECLIYERFVYYMLNKPQGVVSATKDSRENTVLDLIPDPAGKNLFPVGRLDKDTEGLLLITNDGELAHRMLSPKKHVDKVYLIGIREPLTQEDIRSLESGVDIGDEKPTAPAVVKILSEKQILLTIHEGRFHQVKRMLQAVGNEVLSLKRTGFGALKLDETLLPGESRLLTAREVTLIHES